MPGFSVKPAPEPLVRSQEKAIKGSVKGQGVITDIRVESLRSDSGGPEIVATVASIEPRPGSSSMDLFGAILRGVGTTGRVSRTLGGQAYKVEIPTGLVVLTPLAVDPELVVVVAIGAEGAPVEEFVQKVLRA